MLTEERIREIVREELQRELAQRDDVSRQDAMQTLLTLAESPERLASLPDQGKTDENDLQHPSGYC